MNPSVLYPPPLPDIVQRPKSFPANKEPSGVLRVPADDSSTSHCGDGRRGNTLTTPDSAVLPYNSDAPPCRISACSNAARGMRSQYTHPPNGSFKGTPSANTRVRLAP